MFNNLSQSVCVADLKRLARRRIPGFAFDYIEEGCNSGHAVNNNRRALDQVSLQPYYLKPYVEPQLDTNLFGQAYAKPFGIAPLGLTGLVWPQASLMHAKAAKAANIPFVLSTVSTLSVEDAAAAAQENFWFQLYPPSDKKIRADILDRARSSGCNNLVVTLDVPTPSRRIKAIKSGLSVPPKITATSVFQSAMCPAWSIATLRAGLPQFATLLPYIDQSSMSMQDVAEFIRVTLRDVVDQQTLAEIRDLWPGNLIVKGISNLQDAVQALAVGVDGIIVSNHGGRQLDAAQSPVFTLPAIIEKLGSQTTIMVDSGVETGVDVARYLTLGAQMVFAGRAFLYGVAAHGEVGAGHATNLLSLELEQVMSQLHCGDVASLRNHLAC
jgi:isopentenyl diphosphate isomerase/L-lactate dehydrogenase-like FMN-dependent dehydrogenase